MADTQQQPLRYRGSENSYVDVATRGTDESMGINVEYAVHPQGFGAFIVRFIVHGAGVGPTKYKHLMFRNSAKFLVPATETTGAELFNGLRLNKVAIKAFEPAISKFELDKYATKFGIWPMLTEWIAEQITAEGFIVTVDLQEQIKSLMIPKPIEEATVKSIIAFPDLKSEQQQAAALHLVETPEAEDEDTDEDDEDGKDWLN